MGQANRIWSGLVMSAALIMWLLIGITSTVFFSGHAFAVTAGDDFNDNYKDPAKWGTDEVDGKGVMTEINQRLEYTTTGIGTASHDSVDRPWRATGFSYNADWTIQIDVRNTTTSGDFTSFGIYVSSLRLPDNAIEVELAQSLSVYYYWAEFYSQNPISGENYAGAGGSTYGAVRMAFNSKTKVFTVYYNPDPGDDKLWTQFGSFGVAGGLLGEHNGVTNWGLTNTDLFGVTVFGYSVQAVKITSGQLYGDNFKVFGGVLVGPDLIETAVSTSGSPVFRGKSFQVTDTAKNDSDYSAKASTTRYYLSPDDTKGVGDILLTGSRAVPALAPGATSENTVTVTVPGTTPFGTYYLIACADDTKLVAEADETNNCLATKSATIVVVGPDLVETSVSFTPSSVFRGTGFKVTDKAQNNGAQASGASTTRYYLSLDNIKGAGDILLTGSRAVPALASSGGASEGTVTVTVPGTAPFGTYNLFACADDTKVVAETDEGNNCVVALQKLEVTGPDLVEESLSASESSLFRGKSFKVTETVRNIGAQGAGASTTRYYLSLKNTKGPKDRLLTGSRAVSSLASKASSTNTVTVTVPGATPFATYYLLACADDTNLVPETDETNNCLASSSTFEVKGPDLVETFVSDPPKTVFRGATFKVTDTAQNIGGDHATRASVTRYYLSLNDTKGTGDILLTGSRALPALRSGDTSTSPAVTVTVPGTTPFATYYLLACADDTNLVPETDETNNCLASSSTVEVTGPDLIEESVSDPPTTVFRGNGFKVTDRAKNTGAQAAKASVTRYYLSSNNTKGAGDTLLTGSRAVPSLTPGTPSSSAGVTVTVPGTAPFGKYYLLACADDTNLVAETDETNNCLASSSTVEVIGPDLVETSVSDPPKTVFRGAKFQVKDTAQNNGAQVAGASTTRYYLSVDNTRDAKDILLTGSRAVPSLPPTVSSSNTVTVTVPGTTPFATYYLLACADDTKVVPETDESNNCIASSSTIEVAGPDLVETAVGASQSTVSKGKTFKVTDTAENKGAQTTGVTSVTRYYLSLDDTKDAKDILLPGSRAVAALAAGLASEGTVTVTVPGTTATGTYYLFACADDTKVVAETDETNNCFAAQSTIVVVGPDLIESFVEHYQSYVFRNGSFQVTDTAENIGTEPAGASTTRYYLSLDAERDAGDILLTGSRAVPALVPGATSASPVVTVTVPGTTPFGTYYVFACADDTKVVAETSETNNCSASPWTIEVVGPDLVEQSVNTSLSSAVSPGGTFDVTDMVQNIGFEAAGASVTRYYLSLDYAKGPEDILLEGSRAVPALGVGLGSEGTVTVTVPGTTATGTYYLFACADDTGLVAETDELNNCFASGQVEVQ